MEKNKIPTSMAPEVFVGEISGNLQIKGWDEPFVVVRAHPDDLMLEEQDDIIRLDCQGECAIRAPIGATVQIDKVHGSANLKLIEDKLTIGQVNGSLTGICEQRRIPSRHRNPRFDPQEPPL